MLKLNGEEIGSHAVTIEALLLEQRIDPALTGIAVALNDAVITRSRWSEQPISEGDRIEIITAMQGG